jgi:hypothetical protein
MNIKIVLGLGLMLFCMTFNSSAQNTTNAKALFKMWLFLDKLNVRDLEDTSKVSKDYLLFLAFYDVIELKLDTLTSQGFNALNYKFYSMSLDSLQLKKIPIKQEKELLLFAGGFKTFVIGVNHQTGQSYRLVGFNGNDFLSLLSDLKETNSVSNSMFFRNYKVEGLDFTCLYEGLRAKKKNIKQFPCLKRCSDPIISY